MREKRQTDGTIRYENGPRAAVLSDCGTYRYLLERQVSAPSLYHGTDDKPETAERVLLFVMLNPSVADAMQDDPTVRRCCRFAERWGYARMHVVNLYAFRSPHPKALREAGYPEGELNRQYLAEQLDRAGMIVCAWGNNASDNHARNWLYWARTGGFGPKLHHLGRTKSGAPKHPLARGRHRIPDDVEPVRMGSSR